MNGTRVLHVEVLCAMYGILKNVPMFHSQIREDSEGMDFDFNPHET